MARSADGERGGDARRALVMGLYAAVATGIFYGFGVYSQALKHQFASRRCRSRPSTRCRISLVWSARLCPAVRKFGERAVLCLGVCFACGSQAGIYVVSAIHPDAIRTAPRHHSRLIYCVTYLAFSASRRSRSPYPSSTGR